MLKVELVDCNLTMDYYIDTLWQYFSGAYVIRRFPVYILTNSLKNIRRNSKKSILYLLVCIIAVLTLQVYMALVDRTETQLSQLPYVMPPIQARLSNIDGSHDQGLQIPEITVDGLLGSSFVDDLKLTVLLGGWVGESSRDYEDNLTNEILGANGIAIADSVELGAVTWQHGYDAGIFDSDTTACIFNTNLLRRYGWTLGETVTINLYYYRYGDLGGMYIEQMGSAELLIAGVTDLSTQTANATLPRIFIPFEAVRTIFRDWNIPFAAASASFSVRDALMLNEFKAEMKSLGFGEVPPDKDVSKQVLANQGNALLVNDAAYISTATRLHDNLSLLKKFMPLLVVTLAAIGYFVAFLMIQSRHDEYAIYRLLGSSRLRNLGMYFIEIAVLTLFGGMVGVVIPSVTGLGGLITGLRVLAMFSICFLLGGMAALIRLGRTNIMLAFSLSE